VREGHALVEFAPEAFSSLKKFPEWSGRLTNRCISELFFFMVPFFSALGRAAFSVGCFFELYGRLFLLPSS